MDVKTELRALAQRRTELAADLDTVVGRIDELILSGLAAGERPTDLGRAAGLSRTRIYQIKNAAQ